MEYKIKRSKRKTIAFRILNENQILILCPICISDKELKKIIDENQEMIQKQFKKYQRNHLSIDESKLLYHGKEYSYKILRGTHNQVEIINDTIHITCTYSYSYMEVYERFLEKDVYQNSLQYVEKYSKLLKRKEMPLVEVKHVKSKWGSCTYRKNKVMFNTVLGMLPLMYLEEIVCHELCHFLHPNHSKEFHELLELLFPNHRKVERELKKYGSLL